MTDIYVPPHVPPLNPADIPEGCFARWNEKTSEWEFPALETLITPVESLNP